MLLVSVRGYFGRNFLFKKGVLCLLDFTLTITNVILLDVRTSDHALVITIAASL